MLYVIVDLRYWCSVVASAGLVFSSCFVSHVAAQQLPGPRVMVEPRTSAPRAQETDANIRVDSNLVLIPVTVTDRRSRFVTGLEREYFKVFENDQEQTISHFALEDAPISVGIVFDRSDSMGHKLKSAREAVGHFLKSAGPGDEFSLITFSTRPDRSLEFTDQIDRVNKRLLATEASGNTALIDAIYLALTQMKTARNTRKAILIVSDGGDNASRYSIGEIKRIVRESDVQIFAIAISGLGVFVPSLLEESLGTGLLSEVSAETGGQMFEAQSLKDLPKIAYKIGAALRTQYVLGYVPKDAARDGKFHRVKVQLAQSAPKQKLRLSWRHGYYAPAEYGDRNPKN